MTSKARAWTDLWSPAGFDENQVMRIIDEAGGLAELDDLEPLTLERLENALRGLSPRKARGIEAVG